MPNELSSGWESSTQSCLIYLFWGKDSKAVGLIESGIVVAGSLPSVMSGKNYNRAARAHRLVFELTCEADILSTIYRRPTFSPLTSRSSRESTGYTNTVQRVWMQVQPNLLVLVILPGHGSASSDIHPCDPRFRLGFQPSHHHTDVAVVFLLQQNKLQQVRTKLNVLFELKLSGTVCRLVLRGCMFLK